MSYVSGNSQYSGLTAPPHIRKRYRKGERNQRERKERENKLSHDGYLMLIVEKLNDGGVPLNFKTELGRIAKTGKKLRASINPFTKTEFAFSFDYESIMEDELLDKGKYLTGEGDILGLSENGIYAIEIKSEGMINDCPGRAAKQLGRLRYMLSHPDAFTPVDDRKYQRFLSFIQAIRAHGFLPQEMKLVYHCAKNGLSLDATEIIPVFNEDWFKRPAHLHEHVIAYNNYLSGVKV